MFVSAEGKGEGAVDVVGGFRVWFIGQGPITLYEVSSEGVERCVCVSLTSKEWRLRKDAVAIRVQTKKDVSWTVSSNLTEGEVIDSTPVEFTLPPPLSVADEMRRLVREELSTIAERQGLESFEEAVDFDVPDDEDWRSPYEVQEMDEEFPNELEPEGEDAGEAAGSGGHDSGGGPDEGPPGNGKAAGAAGDKPGGEGADRGDSAPPERASA